MCAQAHTGCCVFSVLNRHVVFADLDRHGVRLAHNPRNPSNPRNPLVTLVTLVRYAEVTAKGFARAMYVTIVLPVTRHSPV